MVRGFTHDGPGTPAVTWHAHPERARLPVLELDGYERLIVVAAHPDDESLGAGGLLAAAADRGLAVTVVLCTAGEASHPRSSTHPPAELARRRLREARAALEVLSPRAELVMVGLPDGAVAAEQDRVSEVLVSLLGERGAGTLLAAPWRRDGHPDHEAAGRASAAAARRTDAELVEYPLWWWHWAAPDETPWSALRRLPLTSGQRRRRAAAIDAHASQVAPLSDEPGDETLLGPDLVAHFDGADECFVLETPVDDALDRLHGEKPDPWGTDERWYEERKRDLVLATLPRLWFDRVLDIGCSTGALTQHLLDRAGQVVAVDSSLGAVEAARRRLRDALSTGRLVLEQADLPQEWWPRGRFDLAVVSEVGYFLSPRDLRQLFARLEDTLTPDGVVLLCHWRHEIRGWPLDGPRVHEIARELSRRPLQARYADRDVEILVFASAEVWPEPDR